MTQKAQGNRAISQMPASELFAGESQTGSHQRRPRLVFHFRSLEQPRMTRVEFHGTASEKFECRDRDGDTKENSFQANAVSWALPAFFLDYLRAKLRGCDHVLEGGNGSLASTVGGAINNKNGQWGTLFRDHHPNKHIEPRIKDVFGGGSWSKGHRVVFVQADFLPPECVEMYWQSRRITDLKELDDLATRLRKAGELPPPPEFKAKQTETKNPEPKPQPAEPTVSPGDQLLGEFEFHFKKHAKTESPESEPKPKTPESPVFVPAPRPPPPPINPDLFEIKNLRGAKWDDFNPIINFGSDTNEADVWRLRDACEGLLIFGAVGSGKTSGSGSAIATQFLTARFGGLVLTAKPDEADRWVRLCQQTGRSKDCVRITISSGHSLNILQYEKQRPGVRSVTEDLIGLFHSILDAMSIDPRKNVRTDKYWDEAMDEMLRHLFNLFDLANEPITVSQILRFMTSAPLELDSQWHQIPFFGDIIYRAGEVARNGSGADQYIYGEALQYWTHKFPTWNPPTRDGVLSTFSAMAAVLNGRGIHEMVGYDTNITPEQILSGKVVIMDLPEKVSAKGGMMVQAAWKFLFQQAIERRADKGKPTARPVFLWEDEGHLFFSHHDAKFQPTARDCRAAHVILSQNIRNFLRLGHGEDDVHSVFSAMNTAIFHTNVDPMTNQWASDRIGEGITMRWSSGGLFRPLDNRDMGLFPREPSELPMGDLSIREESRKYVTPSEFGLLKRGGEGTCEAYIQWLAHRFACNKNKPFGKIVFSQEPKP